ncbi:MAG: carbohydrate-binding domain-containing protein [Oscillospiraceae bacterium]|nr:carbohydrate-binding domain-containing protein [Oscillospiraceae bacterium]
MKTNKMGSVCLAAMLAAVCSLGAVPAIQADAAASGDLDSDGKVSASDARLLADWLRGGAALPSWQNADLDGNGRLNAADLTLLKRLIPEEESDPVYIHLNGNSITYEGANVTVSGSTATVTHSGTYYIDGRLTDGQIIVNIPDETADAKTVKLFLNGVEMTNRTAPCIMIENAENTSVNLVDGTENSLSDGTEAPTTETEPAFAVLHAKDDMTIKGSGTLTVTAGMQYGIHCNNDLKFNGGTVYVTTGNADAVRGKTSVTVKDGDLHIDSEGDGIKSTKGSMAVTGGSIAVKSGKDALQAETDMTLTGGEIQACGDRGLRASGAITLDGCTLLATATDYQCENLGTQPQSTMSLTFTKEWAKNNPITLTASGKTAFEQNTLKKFRYAIVSAPALSGSCRLWTGGIAVEANGQSSFSVSGSYADVNNTDTAELLYADLFDQSRVHKIEIEMPNWSAFIADADSEEYYPCDITIDGETIKNVGIRTKGNSSRQFVSQANRDKYSFRVKFDKYDKYANYHGLTELCMNNMYSDPSCMRDILCYNACYEIGAYAPRCAYTDTYVNGSLYSFYFLAEQPGDTLAERLSLSDGAVFYKAADKIGGNGGYDCSFKSSMELDNFEVKFGKDDTLQHIDEVKQAINSFNTSNYKAIEEILDVPSFLQGFAVNAALCNYDSYNGQMAHNFYLVYSEGKMHYVCWDYNLSLGNFMDYGASAESDIRTAAYQTTVADRPLLKLLDVPEYRQMYEGYVKQIVAMYQDPERAVAPIASLIRPHVQADPRFFFTADQFESNIARSANGLQVGGGGGWGGFGGFGWGFGGGGGLFSYGGEQVSIVDFMIKRNEVIRAAIGS